MSAPEAGENEPGVKVKPGIPWPARTTEEDVLPRETSRRPTRAGPRVASCPAEDVPSLSTSSGDQALAGPSTPSQLSSSKLFKIKQELNCWCQDLAGLVTQLEEASAYARHALKLFRIHSESLQTMLASYAASKQHSGDPDSRSAYFEGQVDRLHSMVTDPVLYNWQDCVDRTSDVIHHVCEEVHHIISKEPHSCPARHDLVKHLNKCLKEKEAMVANLEKELRLKEESAQREQMRHKRCFKALEEAHRQYHNENIVLQNRLRSANLKMQKSRKELDHTAVLLYDKEVELANAKKYEQESVTLREHLQETLDLVTRKLTVLQATDRAAVDECKNHAAERDLKQCSGGRADKHDATQSLHQQFERKQLDGEGWNIEASGIHPRNAGDGSDKEKEQLRKQISDLQEQLNRAEARNRNLTSYIASLRQSYAAVFKDTPESSIKLENEDA
ncbi:uncharacterized protein LOC144116017 isoform X2 [Amblyomma americanum]